MLKSGPKPKRKRPSDDTGKLLLKAAAAEFNQRGYDGTDTNRIARRAGFAPQTFYRWYKDKEEIFIEVYREWQSSEAAECAGIWSSSCTTWRSTPAVRQ